MKKTIIPEGGAKPIGPYSPGMQAENMLFVSGQTGTDPATGKLPDDVGEQAEQTLINLGSVLRSAGFDYSDIVKTLVFLTDMDDFAKVNEVYKRFFSEPYPARSCVQVSKLPGGPKVEIECIAVS